MRVKDFLEVYKGASHEKLWFQEGGRLRVITLETLNQIYGGDKIKRISSHKGNQKNPTLTIEI